MLNSIGCRLVRLSAPVLSILVGATPAHATSPTCRDLGAATPYNAFVFGNFSAQSSDVEGRVAIGGNLSISNYSLADKLDAASAGTSVIVGGDFNFSSGRLYFGNAKVAGSAAGVAASVRSGLAPGQSIVDRTTLPIDFAAERSRLRRLSSDLAAIAANGTYVSQWGGLTLTGKANQTLQVFDLPGQLVLDAHTFTVQGIPSGATVLINIRGSVAGLTDMSLESLASLRRRVVFNFPDATQLTLGGISVEGSVLAPKAALQNPQGVIKGQLIAESWNGMMQINHEPFAGCLGSTGPSNRPPVIVSSPATVTVAGRPYLYDVDATDPDGDTLVYARPIGPQGSTLQSSSGVLQWTPTIHQIGVHPIKVSATDPAGAAAQQSYDLRVVQDFCEIYPIALPHTVMDPLAPGAIVNEMPRGTGAGNYSWLSWTGANDAPTLAASLVPPGDSWRYVDPDDASDKLLSTGDYAEGGPGSMDASAVRDAMDVLITRDIILPVWDAKRGQGSKFDYRVQRFVTVRLRDYRLTGNGWISFEYKGSATCYGSVPQAMPQTLATDEDVALPLVLQGSDAEGDTLSYHIVTAPSHGSLTGTAPNLTYVPASNFHGADSFNFKVNDGRSDSAIATVSITVRPANDAPSATPQQVTTDEDTSASIQLTGSDPDGDALSYTILTNPAHGTLSGTPPLLDYVPSADYHGSDEFTFRTRDGVANSTAATVSIVVRPRNDAPIALPQNLETDEGTALPIVLAGSDPDGDPLSFSVQTAPAHGTLTGSAPNLVYTPTAGFDGDDAFMFRASDGSAASANATVSIHVRAVNAAPNALPQQIQTAEDVPVNITLTGTDPDGDALNFTVTSQPAHGQLSGSGADLTYTPDADFNGDDRFAFEVNDGTLDSVPAFIDVRVIGENDPPSATPQSLTTTEDVPLPVTLAGLDADGDPLTYTVLESPAHGSLSGSAPALLYTPGADYHGSDRFTFRTHDGTQGSNAAEVQIAVAPVNDPPRITSTPSIVVEVGVAYRYPATAVDPDLGDVLTWSLVSAPSGMSIHPSTGEIAWTPSTAQSGTHAITLQVRDVAGEFDRQTYQLTLQRDNRPPQILSTPIETAVEGRAYLYDVEATDPDEDVLIHALTRAPNGMQIAPDNGTIGWTAPSALSRGLIDPHTMCKAPVVQTGTQGVTTVDFVTIVDRSGSMDTEIDWIPGMIPTLEAELMLNGIGTTSNNRYGLVDFDYTPRAISLGGQPWGGHAAFSGGAVTLTAGEDESGGIEDGFLALHFALGNYSFREDTPRNILFITDEGRSAVDTSLTREVILAELQAAQVMLNAALNVSLRCGDGRTALGLGQDGIGYVADGSGGYSLCTGARATGGDANTVTEYVPLALATGGAVWDLNFLRAGGVAAESFSRALIDIKVREIESQIEYTPRSDLMPLAIHYLAADGGAAKARVTIRNRGLADAAAATVSLQAVTGSGAMTIGTHPVPALAVGAEAMIDFDLPDSIDLGDALHARIEGVSDSDCVSENDALNAALVRVTATDPFGLSDAQIYAVTVVEANDAPAFDSLPVTVADVGLPYSYHARAIDNDRGDALAYRLLQAPAGMTIEELSGDITFKPHASQAGPQTVRVAARDLQGNETTQEYTLNVRAGAAPLRITSSAPPRAVHGTLWNYLPVVQGGEGATFALLGGPEGMEVDAVTGRLSWQVPTTLDPGTRLWVLLAVTRPDGQHDTDVFEVFIDIPNQAPQITTSPHLEVNPGGSYGYNAKAIDANVRDTQSWALLAGPSNAAINASTGALTWAPGTTPQGKLETPHEYDGYCRTPLVTPTTLAPRVEWQWTGASDMGTVIAARLFDENLDGVVDQQDTASLALVAALPPARVGLVVLNAKTGQPQWTYTTLVLDGGVAPAAGDLDGDGRDELLAVTADRRIVALDASGNQRWLSAPVPGNSLFGGELATADLDGDGSREVLIGGDVYHSDGQLRWRFDLGRPIGNLYIQTALSADLQGDARLELVFQDQVRDASGALLRRLSLPVNEQAVAWTAGNLDADPALELVASTRAGRQLRAYDDNGAELFPAQPVSGVGRALIADFDEDGSNEILVTGDERLYEADGTYIAAIGQGGGRAGGFAADLDMDGALDLISHDVEGASIHAGMTGTRGGIARYSPTSGRAQPPILIDIAGEGWLFAGGGANVQAWRAANGAWPAPLSMSSQRTPPPAYDSTDPLRGTHGQTTALGDAATPLPDLWVGNLQVNEVATGFEIAVDVINRGRATLTQPVALRVHAGDPANGGSILRELSVAPIAAAQQRTMRFTLDDASPLRDQLYATIDAATEGECELRNNQVSARYFALQVSDYMGLVDIQRYALQVASANRLHSISSVPVTAATERSPYTYQVLVSDTDPIERFSYSLTTAPPGAGIDNVTGLIRWTPRRGQAGTHRFVATVIDLDGLPRNQTFNVVVAALPNTPPQITSVPAQTARVGRAYVYVVQAQDAEGDPITYSLEQAAPFMQFDAATGRVSWTPTATGEVQVRVAAHDDRGGRSEQSFNIVVGENRPPTLTSTPPPFARVGQVYTHTATASDPDGDALAFSLDTGPTGMLLTGTGDLSWQPTAAQLGVHDGSLHVSDGLASAAQSFEVTVVAADAPPQLVIELNPSEPIAGQPIQVRVIAEQPGPVSLTLDGNPVTLTNGTATLPPQPIGPHTLVATDAGSPPTTTTLSFTIADPNAGAPIVAITTPAEHPDYDTVTITAPTDIAGSVHDDDLTRWELVAQDRNGGPILLLAKGTDTFDARALATFDPTRLLNGQYQLRLQAWDAAGHQAVAIRTLLVEGDLKLGHYAITFEEASIPVAGIPVTVTRTYDTRRRLDNGDFGYGWTVDASNMRVHESRRLGVGWSLHRIERGVLDEWCVLPNGDPIVSVTMPDGAVEKFRARAVPECLPVPHEDVSLGFTPIEGTDSKLSTGDYGTVRLTGSNLVDLGDPSLPPLDPTGYVLTTAEGVAYTVHQVDGLRRVAEPNGQFLTFSDAGVQHSSGVGIDFVRDTLGRIEQMQLPDGTAIDYVYDPAGDLIGKIDAAGDTAAFGYHARLAHYLETIEDARGIVVSRNEYDDDGKLVATIDADGHRIEHDFDVEGRTASIRDRRGNLTTYVYNDRGDVLSETNALGETIEHTYGVDGNELTRTDALDRTTIWTYDERGNVLTETTPDGETTTRTYSAQNQLLTETDADGVRVATNLYAHHGLNLTSTKDALGHETTFKYDFDVGGSSTGQLDAITDALGGTTSYRYSAVSQFKLSETDALGNRTTFQHDAMGRVTEESRTRTLPGGGTETLTTTYDYDDAGRLTSTTQPDGGVTRLEYAGMDQPSKECDALDRCVEHVYNDRGEEIETRHPDGTTETRAYDPNGNLIAQTDRGGRTTTFVYDAANRLTETIHPDATADDGNDANNPRSTSVYDAAGQLIASIDENGHATTYAYDTAGRRTTTTLPAVVGAAAAATVTDHYDDRGRRIATTDAAGATTRYVYDDAGRHTETIHPDAAADDGNDANNPRTRTEFDAVGRKIADLDANGRITRYAYDKLGRLIAVALPNPVTQANPPLTITGSGSATTVSSPDAGVLITRYRYDEAGQKTEQIDAEGRVTRWEYDGMGREIARVLPEGQRETKAYNEAGELIAHTDFMGRTTQYTYDSAGRPSQTDYPNDADVSYGYTPAGERDEVIDGRGTSTMQYDRRGRVVQAHDADGGLIEYAYDAVGNLESRISPSQSLAYTYDERNRLIEVTRTVDGEAPTITRYEYDAVGNRCAMEGGDGLRTEYTYDRRHRLTNLIKKTAAGAALLAMTYTVDATGMRTHVEEHDTVGLVRTVGYAYDGVKRLTRETIDHRDAAHDRITALTYDRVGNRLTQTLTSSAGDEVTVYAYDENDRLESETRSGASPGTTAYTYDANGNTRTKVSGSDMTTYAYDDANRLSSATTGQGTTTYGYNADGLRVRQTHKPTGGGATTTWYVQDSAYPYAQAIEQYEQVGAGPKRLNATFTFADDLVSQTRYDASGVPTTRFVHADGFGSTRWLTDATGATTDTIDYDAFGVEIARVGTTNVEHLYRGEAFDPNVGFYYLRARWMEPRSGRFTQQDVYLGNDADPASLHKYMYANADPANGSDPSGYFTMMEISIAQDVMSVMRAIGSHGMKQLVRRAATAARIYGRGIIQEMKKCARRPSKCEMPIAVLNTGLPLSGTSQHIEEAQGANPSILSPFKGRAAMILHRTKPHSRSWLRGSGVCGVGRTGVGTGKDCDEYPFASTLEGGRQNFLAGRVSLKPVASWESPLQGALLSQFYGRCKIPRAPKGIPRGAWWSDRSAFVSIAVPTLPSFFICKG